MGRLRNFKTGTPIEHALSKAYEVGFLLAGWRNTVLSAAPGGHAACCIILLKPNPATLVAVMSLCNDHSCLLINVVYLRQLLCKM